MIICLKFMNEPFVRWNTTHSVLLALDFQPIPYNGTKKSEHFPLTTIAASP